MLYLDLLVSLSNTRTAPCHRQRRVICSMQEHMRFCEARFIPSVADEPYD